jgi:hypothetical protein
MDNEVLQLANPGQSVPATPAIAATRRRGQPVWMWWQLLSLDAPTVAVVWALLFARCAGTSLRAGEVFALAAVVWLIYATDRVLDGTFARPGERLQRRHGFYAKHTRNVCSLGIVVLTALACLFVLELSTPERQATLWLLWIVAVYFVWIHLPIRGIRPDYAKELAIGLIFAAGTVLPAWVRAGSAHVGLALAAMLFALLCSLNCFAIEHWEREAEAQSQEALGEFKSQWISKIIAGFTIVTAAACGLAIAASPGVHPYDALFACSGLAAALLLLIHRFRSDVSGEELRILADAALVFPALLALLRIG